MKYIIPILVWVLTLLGCSPNEPDREPLKLSSGTVERLEHFESKYVSPRNIDVWLPDNYSDGNEYAVLYMHDGQMLFDSTNSWNKQEWGVDETMHRLQESGAIRKTMVVGIWSTEFRHSEYFPQKPFESLPEAFQDSLLTHSKRHGETALFKTKICSDDYLKFIVEELKPFIDNRYSTLPDARNTFIAGASMGGLISMYAVCEYPDVFRGTACLSTHWVGTFDTLNNPIPLKFAAYLNEHLPDAQSHVFYFDYGTKTLDALYEPYQAMIDSVMMQQDYPAEHWKTLKFGGANHSENAWRKRLSIPLKFLLGVEK